MASWFMVLIDAPLHAGWRSIGLAARSGGAAGALAIEFTELLAEVENKVALQHQQ